METIILNSHVGADGFLHLKVPDNLINTDCKVVIQPIVSDSKEDLGWSPDFFEKTAGAWEGEPLTRDEQGEYEQREELL